MKKIIPILVVGILVLSGVGVAAVTSNNATMDNQPPNTPEIAGPITFKIGVEYYFDFVATDLDGDNISYYIDWDDGTTEEWGPFASGMVITSTHAFYEKRDYTIRAKAIDHPYGAESDWGYLWLRWKHSSQQSSSIPSSQNAMSVIPSTGKIDVATFRTTIYNGSLSGYVNDTDMNPIEGARVRVHFHGTYEENYSNSTGHYHVTNIPICYCLKNATCSKEGYKTEWVLLGIVEDTNHDFILTSINNPPDTPTIEGPTSGKVGVDYAFTFVATDPDGDDVSYYIDWDDGTTEEWGPYPSGIEILLSHNWTEKGCYLIRCKAIDTYGAESNWAYGWFNVEKKSKIVTNPLFFKLLEQFPQAFPIMRQLLGL